MKNAKFDSLGFDVNLNVPETTSEFDQLAGRDGACLDEAINNIAYRGVLADFRPTFCEALEIETGLARETKQVVKDGKPQVDDDGKPIMAYSQSEARYIAAVRAELKLKPEDFKARFQPLADRVIRGVEVKDGALIDNPDNAITFDPKQRERKQKKIPESYLKLADDIIAKNSVEKARGVLSSYLGREVGSTRNDLALAIQEREAKRRAEANADLA